MRTLVLSLLLILLRVWPGNSQAIDCAYPVIFIHGWTGNETSFEDVYTDPNFTGVWGGLTDVWHGVMNATTATNIWGSDGTPNTPDDDVLVQFVNEANDLNAGCLYAVNLENFWNEDPNNPILFMNSGDTPAFTESDSNESAILKQGYALGQVIEKVLAANPDKRKVIIVGHSMGGLMAREYLQRRTPETPTGTPRWWVDPNSADGHKVAKLVTTVTPHRGSNTLGNFLLPEDPKYPTRDPLPDLASEAVRDLRYSYACGFLGLDDCPGVFLFGGDEDDFISFPYPYWNEDVDCDGDESSPIVIGINISGTVQGTGDEWDGTYDNPDIPLPTDIRYTWITSDIFGSDGDGVVAWSRQWLYNGSTPYPSDGTAHRLTDTLFTVAFHTSVNDDPGLIMRSLDEGDYPLFAWDVGTDAQFGGVVQYRATQAPEGPSSSDPDWFIFRTPDVLNNDIEVLLTPHPGLAGRVDFFGTSPTDYTPMSLNGSIFQTWAAGSGPITLTLPLGTVVADQTYYFRVLHDGIGYGDWITPYLFNVQTTAPLPLDLLSFSAEATDEQVQLQWETSWEEDLETFVVERAGSEGEFQPVGKVEAYNRETGAMYRYVDHMAPGGTLYYRLRITELAREDSFSPVRAVELPTSAITFKLIPNPAAQEVWIHWSGNAESDRTVRIFDALGRSMLPEQHIAAGTVPRRLDVTLWPEGWYVVQVQNGNQIGQQSLLVQHP